MGGTSTQAGREPDSPAHPRVSGTSPGPHSQVSTGSHRDPFPCSLGMAMGAGQRARPWEHKGFAQSFGSWSLPS